MLTVRPPHGAAARHPDPGGQMTRETGGSAGASGAYESAAIGEATRDAFARLAKFGEAELVIDCGRAGGPLCVEVRDARVRALFGESDLAGAALQWATRWALEALTDLAPGARFAGRVRFNVAATIAMHEAQAGGGDYMDPRALEGVVLVELAHRDDLPSTWRPYEGVGGA